MQILPILTHLKALNFYIFLKAEILQIDKIQLVPLKLQKWNWGILISPKLITHCVIIGYSFPISFRPVGLLISRNVFHFQALCSIGFWRIPFTNVSKYVWTFATFSQSQRWRWGFSPKTSLFGWIVSNFTKFLKSSIYFSSAKGKNTFSRN